MDRVRYQTSDCVRLPRQREVVTELATPLRPVLGSGNSPWDTGGPNTGHRMGGGVSQEEIYAEVEQEGEVDSGYTEDMGGGKEDSMYTSSSCVSNLGHYTGDPRVRNSPSLVCRDNQINQRKVFSISRPPVLPPPVGYSTHQPDSRHKDMGTFYHWNGRNDEGTHCMLHTSRK